MRGPDLRRRASAIGGATLAALLCITALPVPAGAATWAGPELISAEVSGLIEVPKDGTQHIIASVDLPAGRWLTTATANLSARGISSCTLGRGTEVQTQYLNVDSTATGTLYENWTQSAAVFIQAVRIPAGGGTVVFKCILASGEDPRLRVGQTRLDAVRVGTLTTRDMASSETTKVGSGSPEIVFGQRDLVTTVDSLEPVTVGRIDLPAGRWWVRAVVPMARGSAGSGPTEVYANCTLKLGSTTASARLGFSDTSRRNSAALQVAGALTASGKATVRCGLVDGTTATVAQGVRIVALRVGTLVTQSLLKVVTSGQGKPVVVWKHRASGVTAQQSSVFSPLVAWLSAAGDGSRWQVLATTQMRTMAETWWNATCRVESDAAHRWEAELDSLYNGGGSIGLSMVGDLTGSATTVTLACTGSVTGLFGSEQRPMTYSDSWLAGLKLAKWTRQ